MCLFPVTLTSSPTPDTPVAQQPPSGPGPPHYRGLTITPTHTHTHTHTHHTTPHSVVLLRTNDRLHTGTSTWQNTTLTRERDSHDPGGTRTRNPRKQAAAYPSLRFTSYSHIIQPNDELQGKITHTRQKMHTKIVCIPLILKLSNYRPGEALGNPGGWGSQNFEIVGTWRW